MSGQFDRIFVRLVCTCRTFDADFIDKMSHEAPDIETYITVKNEHISKLRSIGNDIAAVQETLQFIRNLSRIEALIAEFDINK